MNYQLIERDSENVSGFWGSCHVLLLVLNTVFSMVCVVFFHILIAAFDNNCVLNPTNIVISKDLITPDLNSKIYEITPYSRTDLPVDFLKSQWSNDNACYGSLYNPLLSVIFGLVWLTFFVMCSSGGRSISGLSQPWKIVLPCSIFTFVYSILCIIMSQWLTDGLNNFTLKFENATANANLNITEIQEVKINQIDAYVVITVVTSWIYTCCWIISFFLTILRCGLMPDFKLVNIKVEVITDQESDEDITTLTTTASNVNYDGPSTSGLNK